MENNTFRFIHTGGDPRSFEEFEAIRTEINKLSHVKQPTVDWQVIETSAIALFEKNGVDLLTACYYTYARVNKNGLAGFVEGCELVAALVGYQWENLWPPQSSARTDSLNWFNARIGSLIRKQTFGNQDIHLLQRASLALELISNKLQQVSLEKLPRIENLYFFIQNTVSDLEKQQAQAAASATPHTASLIYIAQGDIKESLSSIDGIVIPQEIPPEAPAEPIIPVSKVKPWHGLVLGALAASVIAYVYIEFQANQRELTAMASGPSLDWFIKQDNNSPRYLIQQADKSEVKNLEKTVLSSYKAQLSKLSDFSPLSAYYYGDNLVYTAQQLWPDSVDQKELTSLWQKQRQSKPPPELISDSYIYTQNNISTLLKEINEADSKDKYVTVGRIRNVLLDTQKHLRDDVPVEEILRIMEQQKLQGTTISPQIRQQMDLKLQALINRYYQLENKN
ncbi:VasL domain-containing protein [Budvicia aquatica]|uniref:VasL domain-containing protein n=1 Tax=Budvicia aquatica TaxID=82979 RepID=UPI00207E7C49|nr:VasL domain-containing protein [Budvicia aquatica]GKX52694.1 membrane protein [Budvicia aquatica]